MASIWGTPGGVHPSEIHGSALLPEPKLFSERKWDSSQGCLLGPGNSQSPSVARVRSAVCQPAALLELLGHHCQGLLSPEPMGAGTPGLSHSPSLLEGCLLWQSHRGSPLSCWPFSSMRFSPFNPCWPGLCIPQCPGSVPHDLSNRTHTGLSYPLLPPPCV